MIVRRGPALVHGHAACFWPLLRHVSGGQVHVPYGNINQGARAIYVCGRMGRLTPKMG